MGSMIFLEWVSFLEKGRNPFAREHPDDQSVEKGVCRVKFKVCALFHDFLLLDFHVNGLAGIKSIVFY
jgi:hypothetical protein